MASGIGLRDPRVLHGELDPTEGQGIDRRWDAEVDRAGLVQSAQEVLAVPELAFGLVALGLLGVMVWLATPSLAGSGVAGSAMLAAGTAGLLAVPLTTGAAVLLVLAAASLCMEVRSLPGTALHACGGGIALALGGLLIREDGAGAHPAVVIPVAGITAAGTYLAGRSSWRRIEADPFTDPRRLADRHTVVLDADGRHGHAVVGGQLWTIRSRHGVLVAGQRVRVARRGRKSLSVEPDPGTGRNSD
jgi:membrane-bound ClpP family serine protease